MPYPSFDISNRSKGSARSRAEILSKLTSQRHPSANSLKDNSVKRGSVDSSWTWETVNDKSQTALKNDSLNMPEEFASPTIAAEMTFKQLA